VAVQQKYQSALSKWQAKDKKAREVIKKINRANQSGGYYLISREDVFKVNQAREAWLELLSVGRKPS
jgi:hypothetical protein